MLAILHWFLSHFHYIDIQASASSPQNVIFWACSLSSRTTSERTGSFSFIWREALLFISLPFQHWQGLPSLLSGPTVIVVLDPRLWQVLNLKSFVICYFGVCLTGFLREQHVLCPQEWETGLAWTHQKHWTIKQGYKRAISHLQQRLHMYAVLYACQLLRYMEP